MVLSLPIFSVDSMLCPSLFLLLSLIRFGIEGPIYLTPKGDKGGDWAVDEVHQRVTKPGTNISLHVHIFFVGKCDRNLATQSNIFRSHSDGISNFSVWGQDVVSISRNKIALTSLSRPASEVRLSFS